AGTERVALLFALDASGSARDVVAQQREAALALFARFGHGSRVAVLHFGDFVRLTVPFTTNADGGSGIIQFRSQDQQRHGDLRCGGSSSSLVRRQRRLLDRKTDRDLNE